MVDQGYKRTHSWINNSSVVHEEDLEIFSWQKLDHSHAYTREEKE